MMSKAVVYYCDGYYAEWFAKLKRAEAEGLGKDKEEDWPFAIYLKSDVDDNTDAPPPGDSGLREAIRARMRLYDSQVDPDCIGTGYDVTDIITISELEQLVGFDRAALGRKEGE